MMSETCTRTPLPFQTPVSGPSLLQESLTQPFRLGIGIGLSSSNNDEPFVTATATKKISLLESDTTQLSAKARVQLDPRSQKVSSPTALSKVLVYELDMRTTCEFSAETARHQLLLCGRSGLKLMTTCRHVANVCRNTTHQWSLMYRFTQAVCKEVSAIHSSLSNPSWQLCTAISHCMSDIQPPVGSR